MFIRISYSRIFIIIYYIIQKMSDFSCSMDGYVEMTAELIELSLFALALVKETYAAILPLELGKSVEYAWDGLVGAGSWAGYAVASIYYFGLEYGYADMMCEYSSYGDTAIGFLSQFISFAS
jgi:hypothetical protein